MLSTIIAVVGGSSPGRSSRKAKVLALVEPKKKDKLRQYILDGLQAKLELEVTVVEVTRTTSSADLPRGPWQAILCVPSPNVNLDMVETYARSLSVRPYILNDMTTLRETLSSRIATKHKLVQLGINTPRYLISDGEHSIREKGDFLEVVTDRDSASNVQLQRPFVQKRDDPDEHVHHIFLSADSERNANLGLLGATPSSVFTGGRKVQDASGSFSDTPHPVGGISDAADAPKDAFLFEEYIGPQDSELKVYVCGDLCIARSKSRPICANGRVKRNSDGKECRHAVTLPREIEAMCLQVGRSLAPSSVARMDHSLQPPAHAQVAKQFKQTVCGIDVVSDGSAYFVIDVNPFSFCKDMTEQDKADFADELARIILDNVPVNLPGMVQFIEKDSTHAGKSIAA